MSKGSASQTPVMRQYLEAKASHPDALMLFRMGDFYELFFEDAVVAARALDLTLTARNKGSEDEIPMAGVPHHAASAYVQRLLEQGFKVAICEQMADPSKVKGIVPREVVRVVSPGIVYDDAGLEARQNHYLVAVERGDRLTGAFGIAALDLSTGELLACEAADPSSALSELVRLDPREALVGPEASDLIKPLQASRGGRAVVRALEEGMDDAAAQEILARAAVVATVLAHAIPSLSRSTFCWSRPFVSPIGLVGIAFHPRRPSKSAAPRRIAPATSAPTHPSCRPRTMATMNMVSAATLAAAAAARAMAPVRAAALDPDRPFDPAAQPPGSDVVAGTGAVLTQGQVIGVLAERARPGDVVIAAAGGPPGDLLKVWDATDGRRGHLEFGFSCMG